MIKVGTIVPDMKVADVAYNTEQIIHCIQSHTDCSLLIFPELCVTGYTCADLFQNAALLQASQKAIQTIANAPKKNVVIGAPLRKDDCL